MAGVSRRRSRRLQNSIVSSMEDDTISNDLGASFRSRSRRRSPRRKAASRPPSTSSSSSDDRSPTRAASLRSHRKTRYPVSSPHPSADADLLHAAHVASSAQLSDVGDERKEQERAYMYNNTYYFRRVVDPVTQVFYQPHTITLLVLMMSCFLYVALYHSVDESAVNNTKMGLFAAFTVLFFVGVNEFPSGPFIRPHPIFWRGVLACSLIYLLCLVFLLFQKVDDARLLMSYIDRNLGVPLPEKSYAENCDLTIDNLKNQLDIFIIAHSLGWFGKALIIRDTWFLWIYSIMFEVMEYSLQHQLANFAECWWDHWILDVLICNGLGIYFGMKTCHYFQMRTYNWRNFSEVPGIRGKLRRSLAQFTPHDWQPIVLAATKSLKNFGAVLILLVFFLWAEVNSFYLKYLLWLPSSHVLNILRLILLVAMGAVGVREMYQYVYLATCRRLGPQAFLAVVVIWTETLIVIKFGRDAFPNPAPQEVITFWIVFIIALVAYAVWICWRDSDVRRRAFFSKRKVRSN